VYLVAILPRTELGFLRLEIGKEMNEILRTDKHELGHEPFRGTD